MAGAHGKDGFDSRGKPGTPLLSGADSCWGLPGAAERAISGCGPGPAEEGLRGAHLLPTAVLQSLHWEAMNCAGNTREEQSMVCEPPRGERPAVFRRVEPGSGECVVM
jgi:hypothetical protein